MYVKKKKKHIKVKTKTLFILKYFPFYEFIFIYKWFLYIFSHFRFLYFIIYIKMAREHEDGKFNVCSLIFTCKNYFYEYYVGFGCCFVDWNYIQQCTSSQTRFFYSTFSLNWWMCTGRKVKMFSKVKYHFEYRKANEYYFFYFILVVVERNEVDHLEV